MINNGDTMSRCATEIAIATQNYEVRCDDMDAMDGSGDCRMPPLEPELEEIAARYGFGNMDGFRTAVKARGIVLGQYWTHARTLVYNPFDYPHVSEVKKFSTASKRDEPGGASYASYGHEEVEFNL